MDSLSFINLAKEDWANTRRGRKQLLFEALLKYSNVEKIIYVNPPNKSAKFGSYSTLQSDRLMIWQSKHLLRGEKFSWIRSINRLVIYCNLHKQLKAKHRWFSFFYNPYDIALIKYLSKHGPVIYDWTEDWSAYHKNPEIGFYQDLAIKKASCVITVTKSLKSRAKELRGESNKVLLLPNATGWKPEKNKYLSKELSQIGSPRIGYFGHVGPWFDMDLVIQLSQARPSWQWVIVGYVDPANAQELKLVNNIHLIGQKPYEELPNYAAQCQVLVAPYRTGLLGDATKLYDYLTLGLPIISSPIETAYRLLPHVHIANDFRSWVNAIESALEEKGDELREGRKKESLKHTWENRAAVLLDWLLHVND